MQYKILSAEELYENNARDKLTTKVEEALNEGWKLQGGVSATKSALGHNWYILFQAMIKED